MNDRRTYDQKNSEFELDISSIKRPESEYELNSQQSSTHYLNSSMDDEEIDELPLLEEIGIDLDLVKSKLFSTIFFFKPNSNFLSKPEMTGPLILTTLLGIFLTLVG